MVAALGTVVGGVVALNETRRPGYVVPYTIVGVLFLAGVLLAVGTLLLLSRRTRRYGSCVWLATVAAVLAFYITLVVANKAGVWDDPMVRFGPEVEANIVIVFTESATDDQISDFVATVLSTPHAGGGHEHRPGLGSLLKVRVGAHDGYAIRFVADATPEQVATITRLISRSPVVWRVYRNVAPENIKLYAPANPDHS